MSRILVLYHSYDEHTARIARRIADRIGRAGHEAVVERVDGEDLRDLDGFDGIVLGAAVRYGHHDRRLERAVKRRAADLASRPNAFFSVCLSATHDSKEAQGYVDGFCRRTGWEPREVATFAGALQYSKYPPLRKLLMRTISRFAGGDTDTSRDYEYTDWNAVERFATQFAGKFLPLGGVLPAAPAQGADPLAAFP